MSVGDSRATAVEWTALGRRFVVRTDDDSVAETLRAQSGEAQDGGAGDGSVFDLSIERLDGGYRVSFEGRTAILSLGDTWPRVDDLIQLLLVRGRPDLRFLHASSVCTESGAAIFVGASTSGKTTLAMALEAEGLILLGDDVAPVDLESRRIHPLHTRRTIRPFTRQLMDSGDLERAAAGAIPAGGDDVPVRWVFFLEPGEGGETRSVSVQEPLEEWGRMYTLGVGEPPPANPQRSHELIQRDERTFARAARTGPCRASTALRVLINHMHPPHPPLGAMLPAVARFFEKVSLHSLTVGHLPDTVSAVMGVLKEGNGVG
ncbi:MAG: hypothetical protein GY851_34000 [bacterium]|nr:hypothetical protein [bacterium]